MKACPFLQRGRSGPGVSCGPWQHRGAGGLSQGTGGKTLSQRMTDPGAVPAGQQGGCLFMVRRQGCAMCEASEVGACLALL